MTDRPRPFDDDRIQAAVEELRRAPPRPPDAVDSVMSALPPANPAHPPGSRRPSLAGRAWRWLREPRLSVSPLGAVAGMATVAFAVLLLARGVDTPARRGVDAGTRRHQFVLVAPGAESVAVVGDFNDWDPTVTPLVREGREGVWVAEVELRGGRHVYSFVIDGERWIPDEGVPRAPDDEFGRPSSVLLVPLVEG